MKPSLSVIIPIYNTEKYLRDCLDSVLNQTFSDFELLAVDDGSRDRSADIVEEYMKADPRIKLIRQENKGPSGARNRGMDMARGDCLYFMDSDDILHPRAFESCMAVFRETDADMVLFDAQSIVEDGVADAKEDREDYLSWYSKYYDRSRVLPARRIMSVEEYLRKSMEAKKYRGNACLYMARKRIIQSVRFLEQITFYEDNLFTFNLLMKAGHVYYVPEKLYCRRLRKHSLMTSDDYRRMVRDNLVCMEVVRKTPADGPSSQQRLVRHFYTWFFWNMAMEHYLRWKDSDSGVQDEFEFPHSMLFDFEMRYRRMAGDIQKEYVRILQKIEETVSPAGG